MCFIEATVFIPCKDLVFIAQQNLLFMSLYVYFDCVDERKDTKFKLVFTQFLFLTTIEGAYVLSTLGKERLK